MASQGSDDLGPLCTVILTTSPTPSNPSTELISETLKSLAGHAPELLACRCIVTCDGYRPGANSKFRSGVVTQERAEAYEGYMAEVERLARDRETVEWHQVEVLRLAERQGFGFAVKAALPLVTTPYVCIMQHDRTFMRPFHGVAALLRAMGADPRLKMVGMPTTTNDPLCYLKNLPTKLGEMRVHIPLLESTVVKSPEYPGVRFIPLIMWHDSTHFASTEYYRNFVFGPRKLVAHGGFIEDKLGQQQGMDLRNLGWSSHAEYGTWLFDDYAPAPSRMVGHLNGKKFLLRSEKAAKEEEGRASKAAGGGTGMDKPAPASSSGACKPVAGRSMAATAKELHQTDELKALLVQYCRQRSSREGDP